jgi:hypothetical protein
VPHYDVMQHNGLYRAKASERMVIYLPDYPCIGIDEEAAFVVNNGNVGNLIQGDEGAKVFTERYSTVKRKSSRYPSWKRRTMENFRCKNWGSCSLVVCHITYPYNITFMAAYYHVLFPM